MGFLDFLFGKSNDNVQQKQYDFDDNGIFTFPGGIKIAYLTTSVNAVLEVTGYKDKLIYTNFEIESLSNAKKINALCGVYQLFTNKPLLLILEEKSYPTEKQVNKILELGKSLQPLSAWEVESILEDCIIAKTVTLRDIEGLNAIKISNDRYKIDEYQFRFEDGVFCSFAPIDGFNNNVKDLFVRNGTFDLYLRHAADYWGNNQENIVQEINYQAECHSKISFDILLDEYFNNKFRFTDGLIDYVSMALCYSSSDVEFDKFEIALHGDFLILNKMIDKNGQEIIEISLPQYNEKQLFVDGHSKSKEGVDTEEDI